MNVGGVPWTGQDDPELKDGFYNVVVICVLMLMMVLLCFLFPGLYSHIMGWQRTRTLRRCLSIRRTGVGGEPIQRRGYTRI